MSEGSNMRSACAGFKENGNCLLPPNAPKTPKTLNGFFDHGLRCRSVASVYSVAPTVFGGLNRIRWSRPYSVASAVGPIAHMISEAVELLANLLAQIARHVVLVQRTIHAPEPLVALA